MGSDIEFDLGDRRLDASARSLHAAMVDRQHVCLRRLGVGRSQEVRYGRLLRNQRVRVEQLIEAVCRATDERCEQRHVLLIEDTSELNYHRHSGRVRGLGTVGNGTDAGLFIHPVLVVDAQDRACLGLAHVHVWQRTGKKAANYQSLPIEDKESHRWIDAIVHARRRVPAAERITVIADREGDIYELWSRLPDARTHLLVRACRDRRLSAAGQGSLFEWLAGLPVQGSYWLEVPAKAASTRNRSRARTEHRAHLQVRWGQTFIGKPKNCSDPSAPARLPLWAIEVREDPASVVGEEEPVHWRLLTTHPVQGIEEALQCVRWYCQRWHIEQTFRTLKSQGLDIESSLLEEGGRLERLSVLALSAAVQTMQLTLAREGQSARPASDCFGPGDQPLLEHLGAGLEGKTAQQKNPHPIGSLARAAWVIARLGGWKGYASERKPGPITMLNGLRHFERLRQGWQLARSVN